MYRCLFRNHRDLFLWCRLGNLYYTLVVQDGGVQDGGVCLLLRLHQLVTFPMVYPIPLHHRQLPEPEPHATSFQQLCLKGFITRHRPLPLYHFVFREPLMRLNAMQWPLMSTKIKIQYTADNSNDQGTDENGSS